MPGPLNQVRSYSVEHQVLRVNPGVGQRDPASAPDGITQRDRPPMLHQRHRGHGPRRDHVRYRPHRLAEHAAFHRRLGAQRGPDLGALFPGRPEPHQRARDGAQLSRLTDREVAGLDLGQVAILALGHDYQVNQPDDLQLAQPVQFSEDLPARVGVLESDDDNLYRPVLRRLFFGQGDATMKRPPTSWHSLLLRAVYDRVSWHPKFGGQWHRN